MTLRMLPLNGSRKSPMVPFYIVTERGRTHAVSAQTAREWWDTVPESRGRIMYHDEAGPHHWDGVDFQLSAEAEAQATISQESGE